MALSRSGGRDVAFEETRSEFESPCLKQLSSRLSTGGRHVILDLGPAVGENVRFFAQLRCKLYIADLYESLFAPGIRQPENSRAFQLLLERELPTTSGQPVDVILAWDLLNYLNRDQQRLLADAIAGFCHRSTQLFAMIATHKEMPARPTAFRVLDRQHLAYEPDRQWLRRSPRYTEPDLRRGLPDFEVDVSFLLRNGLQEYVLNYRPRGGLAGRPGRSSSG